MGRMVHFEIPVDDKDRAAKFYEEAFGWEVQKWELGDYWFVMTGKDEPGIDGALSPRRDDFQSPVTIADVDDIEVAMERVKNAGGTVLMDKVAIPGVGYSTYFLDTEGNTLGLFQSDESVPMPE